LRQEQKADDTPIHVAAVLGNADGITAVLKAGANGKARNDDGNTPFDLAKDNDKLDGTDAYRMLNEARN
jgi:ankyrin repeat protein